MNNIFMIRPDRRVRLKETEKAIYHDAICVTLVNGRCGYLLIACGQVVDESEVEHETIQFLEEAT